jgi:DNA-binding CsgD family transcriptional regulator
MLTNNTPFLSFEKNQGSAYIASNDAYLKLIGFSCKEEMMGKTDWEIPSTAQFSQAYILQDEQVMKERVVLHTIGSASCAKEEWKIVLGRKIPILNGAGKKSVGLKFSAIDITSFLIQMNYMLHGFLAEPHTLWIPGSHVLNTIAPLNTQLTKRQLECLLLLIKGKTAKQIAKQLNLSPRTVEDHCEQLKARLDCHSKSELIDKAVKSGLIATSPEHLLNYFLLSSLAQGNF